jgi:DNA-3-methyladenine glycosylase
VKPLPRAFYERPSVTLARALLGKVLVSELGGIRTAGRIVEAEAYRPDDPASHSFRGPTPGNLSMFGPPGRAYVYRSYGIHWCLNFVCEEEGSASAVLIRALEPVHGLDEMRGRRGLDEARLLCSGPGRLCQALGITREHDALALDEPPFELRERETEPPIVRGPRIGITKAAEKPWRYGIAGSRYLSRALRQA